MDLTFDKLNLPDAAADTSVAVSRQKMSNFQDSYKESLDSGHLTPVPYTYTHHFSSIHPVFKCAMYGRELAMPAGAIIVGKIHKYPVLNVLLKGKLVVVSESGRKVLEAPATYMSEPGVRRIGYVLEDCIWLNVFLTDKVGEENVDEIVGFHTATSYEELDLNKGTQAALEQTESGAA